MLVVLQMLSILLKHVLARVNRRASELAL